MDSEGRDGRQLCLLLGPNPDFVNHFSNLTEKNEIKLIFLKVSCFIFFHCKCAIFVFKKLFSFCGLPCYPWQAVWQDRLGYFWKFSVTNLLTKVAQIFGNFWLFDPTIFTENLLANHAYKIGDILGLKVHR